MVMLRHKVPLIPQELIGHHLGLVVPKKDAKFFWHVRTGKMPKAGYGTQRGKKEYSPNRAFRKLGIPFVMSYSLIDKFKSSDGFKSYLAGVEKEDHDVLACFDYGELHGTDYHHGHVCVVDRVYLKKGSVRLIDPERNVPKWRTVRIEKLFAAMKKHGKEKSGGFWELNRV
jgi:hypothetical protein